MSIGPVECNECGDSTWMLYELDGRHLCSECWMAQFIPAATLQAVVDELADYIQRVEQSEVETTSMYKVGFHSGRLDFAKRIKVTLTQLLPDDSAEEAQS